MSERRAAGASRRPRPWTASDASVREGSARACSATTVCGLGSHGAKHGSMDASRSAFAAAGWRARPAHAPDSPEGEPAGPSLRGERRGPRAGRGPRIAPEELA